MSMVIRTYSNLRSIPTFEERYRYLQLKSRVGAATFGSERYLNQRFYNSREWRDVRNYVIVRDSGSDLGVEGREIHDRIYIHHINPITMDDIVDGNMDILDPEYLISTTHLTHNAIHYGDESLLPRIFVERQVGDTKLW